MMSKLRSYRETIAKVQSVIRQKELDLTRDRIYNEAPDSENRSHDEMLRYVKIWIVIFRIRVLMYIVFTYYEFIYYV